MKRIAADIGGTFTDLTFEDDFGDFRTAKTLTTPQDHATGIMNGLDKLDVDLTDVDVFVHGSTIAINTVLQRVGARTALITTEGFRDVYEIGRGNRSDPYNLLFGKPVPLVPRRLRREVPERLRADGSVLRPLDLDATRGLVRELRNSDVEAVAVSLLHSYANPEHEVAVGRVIAEEWPEVYTTLSHQVLREYREYERTSTTVLNAYVGPVVSRYLDSLETQLAARGFRGRLLIMQSNGGIMSVELARTNPVRMMESGPVAGVIGAAALASSLGNPRVISFDMGGTTAKSSLVLDGDVEISGDGYFIGGYATGQPMALPVVNIVEVGSGGGSIAWVDAAGALKVGPMSAQADPGPACYGLGGDRPTVTDANLVLGRLGAESFLGGEMRLDREAAERAIMTHVAEPLGLDLLEAARGIITIVDAQMSLSVRAVSIEKGEDPREFALVPTGGAGPLHALSLARELKIGTVILPVLPGQFSAKGMLYSEVRHDLTRTQIAPFNQDAVPLLADTLASLEMEAWQRLSSDMGTHEGAAVRHFLELRYFGQEFTISVPVGDGGLTADGWQRVRAEFDAMHEHLYGHKAPEEPVEASGARTVITMPLHEALVVAESPVAAREADTRPVLIERRSVVQFGKDAEPEETPVYDRDSLAPGDRIAGPAIVQEATSSIVIYRGDQLEVAPDLSLVINVGSFA